MPTASRTTARTSAKTPSAKPRRTAAKPASGAPATQVGAPRAKPPAKPPKNAAPADAKPAKLKVPLVRDSFTMPAADFALIAAMKLRALKLMRPTKKSELLRAGLHALTALNDTRFCATLNALTPLKPGRPKKAG